MATDFCGYFVSEEATRNARKRVLSSSGIIMKNSSLTRSTPVEKLTNDQIREVILAEQRAKNAGESKSLIERKYKLILGELEEAQRKLDIFTMVGNQTIKPTNIKPRLSKSLGEATPVLVWSDWHVEEEVKSRTVSGKNKYTLDIAKQRASRIAQSSLKLMQDDAKDVNISEVAVFLIGDFITGNIHEENVENAQLEPAYAIAYATDLIVSNINFLLENTTWDYVFYCKVGNHSRITHKVRASTEEGNSLEFGLFGQLVREYKDNPRVRFHIEPSYYSVVNILGTRVRFHHGHAVAYGGGIGGLHIPLRKKIKSWNESSRADFDIMGHYHGFTENSTLKYMVNGSLIGYNAYAERIGCVMEPPIQGYCLIHKKYGVTRLTPVFAE